MNRKLTPRQLYQRDLRQGKIAEDAAQALAINELERVFQALAKRWRSRPMFWRAMLPAGWRVPVKGLYLWGGVGRGKTYLMELFHQALPGERKARLHFHRFMGLAHGRLQAHKGRKNPLAKVAAELAKQVDVLCFDEFFVHDIGDAMILANLLEALFERGVTLVATSNIAPDKLYERGLQREKFLPAIGLLKQHATVLRMDGGIDYRLRSLEKARVYCSPLGEAADRHLADCFERLSMGLATDGDRQLEVLGRRIQARRWAEGLAWFDFRELCDGPRSAADYIEIAQLFHTVLLSNVPALDDGGKDLARRFISLVDEFYDQNVKLILSAAVPLEQLYQGFELAFPFQRTRSRLLEMQSRDYLGHEHIPA